MTAPRGPGLAARPEDLTAKARIRNAALALFAAQGPDGTSMRAVAGAAGVTVGLIVHHYGTKERLRESVETLIVELFADAIAAAPVGGTSRVIAQARNASVADMLDANPAVVDYLRRTLIDPHGDQGQLLERLAQLAADNLHQMRAAGVAPPRQDTAEQVAAILMTQLGRLFLQPLVDRTFAYFGESGTPRLGVRFER